MIISDIIVPVLLDPFSRIILRLRFSREIDNARIGRRLILAIFQKIHNLSRKQLLKPIIMSQIHLQPKIKPPYIPTNLRIIRLKPLMNLHQLVILMPDHDTRVDPLSMLLLTLKHSRPQYPKPSFISTHILKISNQNRVKIDI